MTSKEKRDIAKLVKRFSENTGTESFIAFVAEQSGMLEACRVLLQSINSGDARTVEFLQQECKAYNASFPSLLEEIAHVNAIFHPNKNFNQCFQILELDNDADNDAIKRAYRKLSKRYHPDIASSEYQNDPQKFIEITRAYHILLGDGKEKTNVVENDHGSQWRKKRVHGISTNLRNRIFAWAFGALFILVIVSVIASMYYKRRAMIAGLQESKGAFVPTVRVVASTVPKHVEMIETESFHRSVVRLSEIPVKKSPLSHEPLISGSDAVPIEPQEKEQIVPLSQVAPSVVKIPDPKKNTTSRAAPLEEEKFTTKPESTHIDVNVATKHSLSIEQDEGKTSDLLSKVEPVEPEVLQLPARKEDNKTSEPVNSDDKKEVTVSEPNKVIEILSVDTLERKDQKAVVTEEPEAKDLVTSPGEIDLQSSVKIFLDDFIDAYQQRNVILYARFFEPDAMENGESFASMLPTYLDLFSTTSDIKFSLTNTSIQRSGLIITVESHFKVSLEYSNSKAFSGEGPITFLINNRNGEFLINSTDYSFDAK